MDDNKMIPLCCIDFV